MSAAPLAVPSSCPVLSKQQSLYSSAVIEKTNKPKTLLRFKEKESKCNGKNSQSSLVHITNY